MNRHRLMRLQLLRTVGVMLLVVGLIAPGTAAASSYSVHAAVPYPVPSQAAVFAAGQDGTTGQSAAATVNGNCETLNPSSVVSIVRGANSIGSAACVSNSFSISITLNEGVNQLVARTANVSGVYGPDSAPITLTLHLPPPPPSPISGNTGSQPSTPAQVTTVTNAGVRANLEIAPSKDFSTLSSDKTVDITVRVSGGQNPYNVMLNWGDGTTESHAIDRAGSYSYQHTYVTLGNYQVVGRVRDQRGAYSQFEYAVVSYKRTGPAPSVGSAKTPPKSSGMVAIVVTTGVGAVVLVNVGYWLGGHHILQNRGRSPARRPKAKIGRR